MSQNVFDGDQAEMVINLKDSSHEQVSIIVVHNNAPEYLNICLQSIAVRSSGNNYEIIVVDNGSDKETQDFLDDIAGDVKVVRNEKNLYWAAAANKGAEAADKHSKYLIFMHHDVVVENRAWIDIMINASEVGNSGLIGLEMGHYKMDEQKVDYIQEWCMLLTRDCWKEIGPLSTELPQFGSNFILTRKAQMANYNPRCITNRVCHHYQIFNLNPNEWERLQEQTYATMPKLLRQLYTKAV